MDEEAMKLAALLPHYLVQRYHGWHATAFTENRASPRMVSVRAPW
jgi:hypothetical protein